MIIYLAILGLIIISGLVFSLGGYSNKRNNLFLFLFFVLIFIVMGFRDVSVGTDTRLYSAIFEKYSSLDFHNLIRNSDASIFYALYNKVLSLISNSSEVIIIANSFLICLLTVIFIKNNSSNPIYSAILFLTLYHFFSAMNISRQYIAIMIFANAFYFLKTKNLKWYLALSILATLFHSTAIISIILTPLFFIKLNRRNIFILISVFIVGGIISNSLINIFSSLFSHYELYLSGSLLEDVGQNRKIIITLVYTLFNIIIFTLTRKKDITKSEKNLLMLFFIYNTIAIIIGFLSLRVMLFSRIEAYFSIIAIIYIPKVLFMMKDKYIYYIIFILVSFIPMMAQLISNNSGVIPYIFR